MDEALKKFTSDVAAEFTAAFDTPEMKAAIEATEKAANDKAGTFEVVITTENLDRYGEVISLGGWELDHYRKNPVVLWGHDHKQPPIGIATNIEIKGGRMVAQGKFAPHEFAQEIRRLYDAGMMRATSVGFIEKERQGNLITKAELLEFSFVSVPANPFALATMVKSGVSINEMVTKGIVLVMEQGEDHVAPSPDPQEVPSTTPVAAPAPQSEPTPTIPQEQVRVERIAPIIRSLKAALVALEDLDTQEPERDEKPQESEEQKAYREFSEKRRILQDASTVLSEVLAEARQALGARNSQ